MSYSTAHAITLAYSTYLALVGPRALTAIVFVTNTQEPVGNAFLTKVDTEPKKMVQLRAIQHPYPMPSTPFSLDFEEQNQPRPLSQFDVERCFMNVRRAIQQHIREHGAEKPIPSGNYDFGYNNIRFHLAFQSSTTHSFYYQYILAAFLAFTEKMAQEEFREMAAKIVETGDVRRVVGEARVFKGDHIVAA